MCMRGNTVKMKRIASLFFGYTGVCITLASCVYFLLEKVMWTVDGEHGYVFGVLYRMFLYHYQHPYQYIAIVSLTYGGIATIWASCWGTQAGWTRRLSIFSVMGITIICSSIPGGMLWVFHDMQAGFFPEGQQFWNALVWGAITGLKVGWIIIAFSIPYNIIGIIIGYWVTGYLEKRTRIEKKMLNEHGRS